MVTKQEYEAEIKEIEARHDLNKGNLGLAVKDLWLRTDSDGKTFLIARTTSGNLPLVCVEVVAGFPESVKKDDIQVQLDRREKDVKILQERVKQEAIAAEVKKRDAELQKLLQEKRDEIHKESEQKVSSKLKKMFGGK